MGLYYLSMEKIYTVKQVAEKLGLKPVSIKAYCQRYDNIGFKLEDNSKSPWLLTDKDIEFIKTRLGKVGQKN